MATDTFVMDLGYVNGDILLASTPAGSRNWCLEDVYPASKLPRTFEDDDGVMEHVLLGLIAEGNGWTTVHIRRTGTAYYFHSVEVSHAN